MSISIILTIFFLLFLSATAIRPLVQDVYRVQISSKPSVQPNSQVLSRFPTTSMPVISPDINRIISTNFLRNELKIVYSSFSSLVAACEKKFSRSNFQNSIFWKNFQCRMGRLLYECFILIRQLYLNKFQMDSILSIVYAAIPNLFFQLHIHEIRRAFMPYHLYKTYKHGFGGHHFFYPHWVGRFHPADPDGEWRPYPTRTTIYLDVIVSNREYPAKSNAYHPVSTHARLTSPSQSKRSKGLMGGEPDPKRHFDRFLKFLSDPSSVSNRKRLSYRLRSIRRLRKSADFPQMAPSPVSLGPAPFGPGFSSDNAGDGPVTGAAGTYAFETPSKFTPIKEIEGDETDVELVTYPDLPTNDVCKYTPAYASETFADWIKDFKTSLPADLDLILSGQEERHPDPEEVGDKEFIGNTARNHRASLARSRLLYRILAHAIQQSTSSDKAIAQATLRKFENYQAKEAWDAIVNLHDEATSQNKFISLQALLSLKQKPSETVQSFKLRVDAALQRIQTLGITFDDISVVHFLMGLHDRYQGIVDTLYIKGGELTLDSVSCLARAAHSSAQRCCC